MDVLDDIHDAKMHEPSTNAGTKHWDENSYQ